NVYALRRILEVEALRTALPKITKSHIQKLERSLQTQRELTVGQGSIPCRSVGKGQSVRGRSRKAGRGYA
ncbi:MAG: FCD domain-containing protein, partial [Lachnospiraceae bacterium]|nr:FCD domain-containing protein [Lachnospiraceae bacterium]